jgi:type V secretory pathway adhesin AidA
MTDSSNNPTATLPYVTQLSQQEPDDEDEAEEPNDIITDPVAPNNNTNTNTSDLRNVVDIAFDFIVKKNPHIHPVQHSQMMTTVLVLLQSTSECCEKIGKLSAKCKRAKAKSIELTNIVNSVTQQI